MNKDILERLEEYGADCKGSIARFLDNEELYIRCINMFLTKNDFEKLADHMASQDYSGAFASAHTLKGVTGNLGLTALYDTLCKFVDHLRGKNYSDTDKINALYADVVKERDRFFSYFINSR